VNDPFTASDEVNESFMTSGGVPVEEPRPVETQDTSGPWREHERGLRTTTDMRRRNAMLLAGTCAGAVVAMLVVAAAIRPPGPAAAPVPPFVTTPSVSTSVATTATSAPPETSAWRFTRTPSTKLPASRPRSPAPVGS